MQRPIENFAAYLYMSGVQRPLLYVSDSCYSFYRIDFLKMFSVYLYGWILSSAHFISVLKSARIFSLLAIISTHFMFIFLAHFQHWILNAGIDESYMGVFSTLEAWVQCCGNPELENLSVKSFDRRFVCSNHFNNSDPYRKKLNNSAYPIVSGDDSE